MDTSEQSPYISYDDENKSFTYGLVIFVILIVLLVVYLTVSKSLSGRQGVKIPVQY